MNRELIVTLLKKNIDDLILLTEGFEEMTSYPASLIHLAQLKTNDIKQYLYELGELKQKTVEAVEKTEEKESTVNEESVVDEANEASEVRAADEANEASEVRAADEENEASEVSDQDEENEVIEESESLVVAEPEASSQPAPIEVSAQALPVAVPEMIPFEEEPVIIAEEKTESKKTTLGEKMNNGITRNDLLSSNEPERFHNSVANKKIDDIRQAISIGDRFRFQRELFRNNGEEMNKMLNYINLLASFNEIETFLQKKYSWEADNTTVQDFYAIVRRKFI
jgi:hypothetical protein